MDNFTAFGEAIKLRAQASLHKNIKIFEECLPIIGIRHGCSCHLDVIAAEEEQQGVAREAHDVRDENELHGAFGPQLESLQQTSAHEDTDTRPGDRNRTWDTQTLKL